MTIEKLDNILPGLTQCNDCGAYSLDYSAIEHYKNCMPGESQYWENYYNQPDDENDDESAWEETP